MLKSDVVVLILPVECILRIILERITTENFGFSSRYAAPPTSSACDFTMIIITTTIYHTITIGETQILLTFFNY